MLVAITGGTGFVGSRLVNWHVRAGDRVRILTRRLNAEVSFSSEVEVYCGDLNGDENILESFSHGADVLYHCAGEIKNEDRMYDVHVDGTKKLIEAASARVGRWVQLSSVGAYGPHRTGLVTEKTPLKADGVYETTKVLSDRLVEDAASNGAFDYMILRPSIIFGDDMPNQSINGLVGMIERRMFFFIGKPGASANYIHVDNVVDALLKCGKVPSGNNRVYNLSDYCTLEEFVETIARCLGRGVPKVRVSERLVRGATKVLGKLPGWPLTRSRVDALTVRSRYPIDSICNDLGYDNKVSIQAGLERLVESWKAL